MSITKKSIPKRETPFVFTLNYCLLHRNFDELIACLYTNIVLSMKCMMAKTWKT